MSVLRKIPVADALLSAGAALLGALVFERLAAAGAPLSLGRDGRVWPLGGMSGAVFGLVAVLPLLVLRYRRRLIHRTKEAIHAAARRDPLTGLNNLIGLHECLERRARLVDEPMSCLMMVDIDRFKSINDLHGHDFGDAVLIAVAERLRRILGPGDRAFRLGGDEFAILCAGAETDDAIEPYAARVMAEVSAPIAHDRGAETLSCSVGIVRIEPLAASTETVHRAEQALFHAKTGGGPGWAVFDEALGIALRGRALLETELRDAVLADAIVPYFQPILRIETGALTGFEVLARWHRDEAGFVPPDVFIPMAEEMGLIDRLSDQLLRKCCLAMAGWPEEVILSFNLSPRQLNQSDLTGRITGILSEHGIHARRLALEITETAVFIDIARARTVISDLRARGVRVSLDDFGIGTSSLAVLSQLPFDTIKIDRSFISNVRDNPQNAKIVRGVLALARSLELTVTAEGIESDADLDFLRENDCILGQGYYFSRPVPEDALPGLIEEVARAAALAQRDAEGSVTELPRPAERLRPGPRHAARKALG